MSSNKSELSNIQNYIIGAVIGFSESFVTNPFFIVKTNLQQNTTTTWSIKGLYKGVGVNSLSYMPITSIQVGTTKWLENSVYLGAPNYIQKITSAFAAGALSSFVSCPIEMIMNKQNNNHTLSAVQAFKSQIKTQGLLGLFVGQFATALREGIFSVFFLAVTPIIKNILKQYYDNDTLTTLSAGAISGSLSAIASQPFDTIKTKQQKSGSHDLKFFKLVKDNNIKILFSGLLPRVFGISLSITYMSFIQEQLENYCIKNHNPKPH